MEYTEQISIWKQNYYKKEVSSKFKKQYETKFRKLTNNKLKYKGKRRPKIIYVFGGLLFLSILLGIFYFRLSKKLKNLNKDLNQSVNLNKKVFSILSHDLKQPIYSLEAMFFLLDQNQLSEDEKVQSRDMIKNHLKTTRLFMDDLMTWSKLEIVKQTPIDEKIKPYEIIQSISELYSKELTDKSLEIVTPLQSDITISGNIMIYHIVLKNLIHNAIKFCFNNSKIRISHSIENQKHQFSILNYGPPIPEELQNRMFDENKKLQYIVRNESKLGFGLGLSIISAIIKDNNGKIWLSKDTKGSTVKINFYLC